jgi:hypothetical protein
MGKDGFPRIEREALKQLRSRIGMGHLVTDWKSDEGFLEELYAELRSHHITGDTT